MNRAERRAAAALAKKLAAPQKHRPPRQPGKPIRPWPHEVRHVFAPIEQIFDELRQGEITGKWCAGECAAFSATPDRKQPQKTGEPQNRPTEPQTKK